MNYRDLIQIMEKHKAELKSLIDAGKEVEYFTGALDEVDLLIEVIKTILRQDTETALQIKELMKNINVLEERRKGSE